MFDTPFEHHGLREWILSSCKRNSFILGPGLQRAFLRSLFRGVPVWFFVSRSERVDFPALDVGIPQAEDFVYPRVFLRQLSSYVFGLRTRGFN